MQDKPAPPFDAESEKLKDFKQVVWSSVGAGSTTRHRANQSDLEEVLRQASLYPNVTGAGAGRFFPSAEDFESNTGDRARHTIDSIRSMRDQLHGFPDRKLDLWLVWYDYQLDFNVENYVNLCDVITLWTCAGDLDAALHGLGAAVHRQHHALAAQPRPVPHRTGRAGRSERRG